MSTVHCVLFYLQIYGTEDKSCFISYNITHQKNCNCLVSFLPISHKKMKMLEFLVVFAIYQSYMMVLPAAGEVEVNMNATAAQVNIPPTFIVHVSQTILVDT